MSIEWLGTPQALLAAIALAFLAIALNEYWEFLKRKRQILEFKAEEAKIACVLTLSFFAPHILHRLTFQSGVEKHAVKWWAPWRSSDIFLVIISPDESELKNIEPTINDKLKEFLAREGNQNLRLRKTFKVKGVTQ
jgi:hypothetical protein